MDKQIQQAIEGTTHYLAKTIRGWINGDATQPIQDPEFDLIRKWIVVAKAPRPEPVIIANPSDAQKYRDCLVEILHDTKSRTTRDLIMTALNAKQGTLEPENLVE